MGVMKFEWIVDCATCGDVTTWQNAVPTECPNNPAHTVNGISGGGGGAPDNQYMQDSNGDVWKMTMGTDGVVVTLKVT